MKIVTIIGARPQFIKAAVVSTQLRKQFTEVLVHTGQHYDGNMSDVFFQELDIPLPAYNLNTGMQGSSKPADMAPALKEVIAAENPSYVLLYGDTNSTLAGALAAHALGIKIIHIEAGLRSFNDGMPEEYNRVETDKLSALLFAPTPTAVANLERENIQGKIIHTGDVMCDAVKHFSAMAAAKSMILNTLELTPGGYMLATVHRAENTDNADRLGAIVQALNASVQKIVLPLHPRTRKRMQEFGLTFAAHVQVTDPAGYLDMLCLQQNAAKIITDSGGMQKEAYILQKPCITLRDETEWVETVESGWNLLVGADVVKIPEAIQNFMPPAAHPAHYGNGQAAAEIVEAINLHAAGK